MRPNKQYIKKAASQPTAGFTFLELMVVVFMMGILSAIATPSWLGFVDRQRLNSAQDQVYWAMQEAKSKAKLQKITWQASFREIDGVVQWAVHPARSQEFIPIGVNWNPLGTNISIDKEKNKKAKYETTFDSPGKKTITGPWRVQFNFHGNTNGQLGTMTLRTKHTDDVKRCVIVSTLIGTIRTGKEHAKPKDGKYCY
ncbi:prepilin-type N-terminal cleavage/methylation domain-containing protein [Lyngbya aestuarii]|uniref:prepilin-type N-terminal cleavage/methylation domain-containing protein n=1 Tax=Lyngbya aestuarii TaxID=118322 RepID=UPI00403D86BB